VIGLAFSSACSHRHHRHSSSVLTTSLVSACQEQWSGPVQANLTKCGLNSHRWSGWPVLDQTAVPGMQMLVKLLMHCMFARVSEQSEVIVSAIVVPTVAMTVACTVPMAVLIDHLCQYSSCNVCLWCICDVEEQRCILYT